MEARISLNSVIRDLSETVARPFAKTIYAESTEGPRQVVMDANKICRHGYHPSREGIDALGMVARRDTGRLDQIKATLDPNRMNAPGRYV